MLHPSQTNMVRRGSLANSRVEIVFHGRAAHAAGAPDLGINALEAVIQTFVGLNARRLHMREDARVHGIITDGGQAVNIIPDRAAARFSVRARDRAYQRRLMEMVRQCAEAGALATGATPGVDGDARLQQHGPQQRDCGRLREAPERDRPQVDEPRPNQRMGSTDMGDISQIMPAIHAYLSISPPHRPEPHRWSSPRRPARRMATGGHRRSALTMALTAADFFADPSLVAQAKAEYAGASGRGDVAGYDAWLEAGKLYAPAPRPA